jgi:hypothetical protein
MWTEWPHGAFTARTVPLLSAYPIPATARSATDASVSVDLGTAPFYSLSLVPAHRHIGSSLAAR